MGVGFVRNSMKMNTRVKREDLIAALKRNQERHTTIVAEARAGYVQAAKATLLRRLNDLEEGRIVDLQFKMAPPLDYSEAYRTALQMLEMNQDDTIVLTADEFRCLVLDEWDWTSSFFACNSVYSATAGAVASSRDFDNY